MSDNDNDPLILVRKIVRDVLWEIHYHEKELANAHKNLEYVKALLVRTGIDEDGDRASEANADEEIFESADQYMLGMLDEREGSVGHHEESVTVGYGRLAMLKILLARGRYTDDEVNLAEIDKQVKAGKR